MIGDMLVYFEMFIILFLILKDLFLVIFKLCVFLLFFIKI